MKIDVTLMFGSMILVGAGLLLIGGLDSLMNARLPKRDSDDPFRGEDEAIRKTAPIMVKTGTLLIILGALGAVLRSL
jgi:hypothetical protein